MKNKWLLVIKSLAFTCGNPPHIHFDSTCHCIKPWEWIQPSPIAQKQNKIIYRLIILTSNCTFRWRLKGLINTNAHVKVPGGAWEHKTLSTTPLWYVSVKPLWWSLSPKLIPQADDRSSSKACWDRKVTQRITAVSVRSLCVRFQG